jgi:hypothetical protein
LNEDIIIKKPKKKPKHRKLNGGERLGNRIISRKRFKIEMQLVELSDLRLSHPFSAEYIIP